MDDPTESIPDPREVCCVALRAVFNYLRYDKRVAEGSLLPPEPKPKHRHRVIEAQFTARPVKALFDLKDRDGITIIARTFDWINPDGSIGNWGKRDPKYLLVNDEVWIPHRGRAAHFCSSCRLYNERFGKLESAPSPCAEVPQ